MTLLEFITDLQSQGFTDKEVFDKAQEFKKSNTFDKATEEVVEETVEDVEVGNSNDSLPTGADVDQTTAAPDTKKTTDLILEDGSSVSAEEFEKIKAQYKEYTAVAKPEEVITKGGYDYKYDDKGNQIESVYSSDDYVSTTTYEYTYDSKGNWIKKIEFENGFPQKLTERTIEYYE